MAPSEVVHALSQLALFGDLPQAELEAAAHTFKEELFEPGRRVLRQGLSGSAFFVILEGEASVRRDGVEQARLQRGDFFGEISVLLGEPPIADVVAERTLRCLVIPGSELEGFLRRHPDVAVRMLVAEARRLRDT